MLPYFQTDNTALALALAICGVPAPVDDAGNPVPQLMFYDKDTLRRWGYKDMPMDEAAMRAIKARRAGKRVFQFQRTPELNRITEAFNKARTILKAGDNITIGNMEVEDVAMVIASTKDLSEKMMSAFSEIPCFVTDGSIHGEASKDSIGWSGSGTFAAVGVRASQQLKSEVSV
jgi:hypothetical protein